MTPSPEKEAPGAFRNGVAFVPERAAPGGNLCAEARVSAQSSWYEGHFPGSPILPGLAQLALIQALIRRRLGTQARIQRLSRVRFRQALLPEAPLRLTVIPKTGGAEYQFKIVSGGEIACSGSLTINLDGLGNAQY